MFSQSKPSATASFGSTNFGGWLGMGDQKKVKPPTAAEKYEQALVTAHVFLENSRARVTKSVDKYQAVANSNYWFYGYFGGNMVAWMAGCLALGSRWSFFSAYSGWIALAGGYFGGKACLGLHSNALLAGVITQIDHEITESQRMDSQSEHMVPDYLMEAERLTKMKYELAPTLPEAIEHRAQHSEQTLDDRADALIEAYMKRKEMLKT